MSLTGKPVLLPRYAFGFLGSSMYPAELPSKCDKAHLMLVDKCRKRKIPIDSWQLSSGYTAHPVSKQDARDGSKDKRSSAEVVMKRCTLTWNLTRFPNPMDFMSNKMLRDRHIVISPNTKPGMLVDHHPLYREFADAEAFLMTSSSKTSKPYVGAWWGGRGSFVDFTNPKARELWKRYLKQRLLKGTPSVWNDNNEYDSVELGRNPPTAHYDGARGRRCASVSRVIQSNLMARCAYESVLELRKERPFIISRSGSTGICRYAQTWSGDNKTSWQALRTSLIHPRTCYERHPRTGGLSLLYHIIQVAEYRFSSVVVSPPPFLRRPL